MSFRAKILIILICLLLISNSFAVFPSRAADDVDDLQDKIEKYEDKKEQTEEQLNNAQVQLQKKPKSAKSD